MSKSYFLKDRCNETFLPLKGHAAEPLLARGVVLAGLSKISPPYEIERSDPRFHSLNMTLGGAACFESKTIKADLDCGCTWMVPAHTPCQYRVPRNGSWEIIWFHLDDLDRWQAVRGRQPRSLDCDWANPLKVAMEGYVAESLQDVPGASTVALHHAEIIGAYLDRILLSQNNPGAFRAQEQLARLWASVNGSLNEPWTVESLASAVGVSPAVLRRWVREHNGTNPGEMVTRLRMNRAEELLSWTHCTLDEIAERVGYQSAFSFSKSFKRVKGCCPRKYRMTRFSRD